MSDIAHHLIRRGYDAAQQYNTANVGGDGDFPKLPFYFGAILWITAILYFVVMAAISYTYGDVIATLSMIETPTATAYLADADDVNAPLLDEKPDKAAPVEADLFLVKQTPVTSKMRTAVKHITSIGGFRARFRGLGVALLYDFAYGLFLNVFSSPGSLFRPFIAFLSTILLARLQMTWTHIVIAKPSEKSWYQRWPSTKQLKNILLPTAVFALAKQAAIYIPAALAVLVMETWKNPSVYGGNPETVKKVALVQMLSVGLMGIATVILVVIPANVTLKRVQASMLPEEDDTMVSFDRTFAGKVVPEVVGGSGAVGMLDAWKSFDKSARLRLIKLYGKIFAVQVAITLMFFMVVGTEIRMMMGEEFPKFVNAVHGHFKAE